MNIEKLKKHKKIILIVLAVALAGTLFFVFFKKTDFASQLRKTAAASKTVELSNKAAALFGKRDETKIGWISDIHADRFKRRDVNSGTLFPRRYDQYLPRVFDDLRRQGIFTVVATGDNTNSGDDNYAKELERIAREKNMHVIWVKGNHDNAKVMSVLGAASNYYYVDQDQARIVVLDDVESDGNYYGAIDDAQIEWLKGALRTDKQVIVCMHIPIFLENNLDKIHAMNGGDFDGVGDLLERYQQLENVLRSSGNVKLVLSGHWHLPWHKQFDGIDYYGQAALTRTGYDGSYAIVDLKNTSVTYLFAR